MSKPEVVKFPDGHFRKAIWSLASIIADYPEQVLYTCIVQGWCAKLVCFPVLRKEYSDSLFSIRCYAKGGYLEETDALPRKSEHAELLVRLFSTTKLRKEYGIVKAIIVRLHHLIQKIFFDTSMLF